MSVCCALKVHLRDILCLDFPVFIDVYCLYIRQLFACLQSLVLCGLGVYVDTRDLPVSIPQLHSHLPVDIRGVHSQDGSIHLVDTASRQCRGGIEGLREEECKIYEF